MTGFGAANLETEAARCSVEIRSVNNKFLKTTVRLPDEITALETDIETAVSRRLRRGSVMVTVRWSAAGAAMAARIDADAAEFVRPGELRVNCDVPRGTIAFDGEHGFGFAGGGASGARDNGLHDVAPLANRVAVDGANDVAGQQTGFAGGRSHLAPVREGQFRCHVTDGRRSSHTVAGLAVDPDDASEREGEEDWFHGLRGMELISQLSLVQQRSH
jgi:hypothetical protein